MNKKILVLLVVILLAAAGTTHGRERVTLMTHDSFEVSASVVKAFEDRSGAELTILKSGDAGEALTKAILSKNHPLADVFFGVDNTFMSRALAADIFEPCAPKALATVDDSLKLDTSGRLIPIDYGDVALNYDKGWFEARQIAPPENLEDLNSPAYKGLTAVEDPATSSPGLAFLLATVGQFGPDGYLIWWENLKANGVEVASGWEQAYFGLFSAAGDGERPIVVSYATSPAAEVYYAEDGRAEPRTAAVTSPGSTFRQVEFAGILKGAKNPQLARELIDFMLSAQFQEDIPLNMFMFPANSEAELPEVFARFAAKGDGAVSVPPQEIEKNRDAWIKAWTKLMLR